VIGWGAISGRARCLSDIACGLTAICGCARRSWILARRKDVLAADGVFSPLDRRRLSPSGTIRQLPDGDAIPPSAGSGRRHALPEGSLKSYLSQNEIDTSQLGTKDRPNSDESDSVLHFEQEEKEATEVEHRTLQNIAPDNPPCLLLPFG
jgi:hypothetical protein